MAHAALSIPCPTCTVPVGEECITVQFDKPKPRPPHASRLKEAKEQGLTRPRSSSPEKRFEKRVIVEPSLDPNYPGPFICDYVMYAAEEAGEVRSKSFGHTGRVLAIQGEHGEILQIRPTRAIGDDIPWDGQDENDTFIAGVELLGWWPEDQVEPKSQKNMRKVNRWT